MFLLESGKIQKKKDEPKIRKESIVAILFIIVAFAGMAITAKFGPDVAKKAKDPVIYGTSIILINLRKLIPAFMSAEKKIGTAISTTYDTVK